MCHGSEYKFTYAPASPRDHYPITLSYACQMFQFKGSKYTFNLFRSSAQSSRYEGLIYSILNPLMLAGEWNSIN